MWEGLAQLQRQMFDEAADFGLTRGITVPIRTTVAGVSTMTMVTNGTETSFSHNVEQNRHLIHLVALHFDANITGRLGPTPAASHRSFRRARPSVCVGPLAAGPPFRDLPREISGHRAADGRISPGKCQAEIAGYDDAPGHRRSVAAGVRLLTIPSEPLYRGAG